MKKAVLYKKLGKGMVQCLACPWYCRMAKGDTGVCAVRQNIDGELQLLVYGLPSAVHVDPIEKKPLFHFMPGSEILSFGTVGCNLDCDFCQNWDLSQASKKIKRDLVKGKRLAELPQRLASLGQPLAPKEIISQCVTMGIPSIAYTYNEPSIFFEYAYDTAKLAHAKGIKNVFVSNGFTSKEAIAKWKGILDANNIDLKSFRKDFYERVCHARLEPVLESIKRFAAIGTWVEITTLVIPGENDSEEELTQIAEFIASVSPSIPWHVSRFHPSFRMQEEALTPIATLEKAYEIGKRAGLKHVYVGNIPDERRESTFCPSCGETLVRRHGYEITIGNFDKGKCGKCGNKIEGVWE